MFTSSLPLEWASRLRKAAFNQDTLTLNPYASDNIVVSVIHIEPPVSILKVTEHKIVSDIIQKLQVMLAYLKN